MSSLFPSCDSGSLGVRVGVPVFPCLGPGPGHGVCGEGVPVRRRRIELARVVLVTARVVVVLWGRNVGGGGLRGTVCGPPDGTNVPWSVGMPRKS